MSERKPSADPADLLAQASAWWSTSIIEIHPGTIRMRGHPIEDLIGRASFAQMIWLMLRGTLPSPEQAALLEAMLVASVDHGPHAPSIAIARMSVTCGLPLNGAMASAINVLDDVHGGAGEQCLALYQDALARCQDRPVEEAVEDALDDFVKSKGKIVPGFGHRFHPIDPRAPRLLAQIDEARAKGVVEGKFAKVAQLMEMSLERRARRRVPMNIDGVTAAVCGELGFEAPLARGLFILSRSVGILAHAWEQTGQHHRIKGPMPPSIPYRFTGTPERGPSQGS